MDEFLIRQRSTTWVVEYLGAASATFADKEQAIEAVISSAQQLSASGIPARVQIESRPGERIVLFPDSEALR